MTRAMTALPIWRPQAIVFVSDHDFEKLQGQGRDALRYILKGSDQDHEELEPGCGDAE